MAMQRGVLGDPAPTPSASHAIDLFRNSLWLEKLMIFVQIFHPSEEGIYRESFKNRNMARRRLGFEADGVDAGLPNNASLFG